jgi:death on curing protein
MNYFTLEQIVEIHMKVMARYGEGEQARVMFPEKLASAVLRPQAVFFGQELFTTVWDKAGALVQSVAQEHIFHNGNKRTAFAVTSMAIGCK